MAIKKSDMEKLSLMTGDIERMREYAVTMLRDSNTKGTKKAGLIADLTKYTHPNQILKTMWNAFLSGERLSSVGSRYNRSRRVAESYGLGDYYTMMIEADIDNTIISFSKASKYDYQIYHKTFSSAVQHARAMVEKRGYTVDEDEWFRKVASGPRKPGKGKTNIYTIELMENGKESRRKLQMQVYYDEGRYELNMYIS